MSESWKQWEGQVVDGRFPLLQYLGGGPRSAVFLTASDEPAVQKAAIKVLQTDPGSQEQQLARWEAASTLRHDHLVRLFHTGRCELDGEWLIYLVMECADEDLGQVLPRRALSAEEAREALDPALEALAFLHSRGYVLTSLRPANILAVGDQLRLASEHIRRAGEPWEHGFELGPYDAPELPRDGISPAADVWSLGVTLVEALTQRPPVWDFPSSADPVLPPGIPEPFREIVRQALQRDPAWRWNVQQIQARLLETAPSSVAPAVERGRPAGTRRRYGRLAALVLAALAVMLVGLWVFGPRPAQPPPSTPAAVEQAPPQPKPKTTPQPEPVASVESAAAPAAPSATAAAPEAAPAAETRSAAGSESGEVVEQVLPDVLPKARASIQGSVKVAVKVHVDASGKVVEAQLAPAGPSKYFAKEALAAAKRWKFRPAGTGEAQAASEWLLQFQFERSGTTVKSQPLAR